MAAAGSGGSYRQPRHAHLFRAAAHPHRALWRDADAAQPDAAAGAVLRLRRAHSGYGYGSRSPFMSGLMGGLIGAGIGGLLFGHGLFGGITGFGGFLGLLLQIFLIVLAGALADAARVPASRRFAGGRAIARGAAAAGIGAADAAAACAPDARRWRSARRLPDVRAAAACGAGGVVGAGPRTACAQLATPEMVGVFAEQLAEQSSRGVRNIVTDVRLEQGDLAEAWSEGDRDYATVAMRFSMLDATRGPRRPHRGRQRHRVGQHDRILDVHARAGRTVDVVGDPATGALKRFARVLAAASGGGTARAPAVPVAAPTALPPGVRGRIFLYLGALIVLLSFGAPSGGLIDIPITFLLKNKLHLEAHEVATFRMWAALPFYLSFVVGFLRDIWNPFGMRDRGFILLFGAVSTVIYLALRLRAGQLRRCCWPPCCCSPSHCFSSSARRAGWAARLASST